MEARPSAVCRPLRKRIIPAVLLWCICPLILIGYLLVIGRAVHLNIGFGWFEPEPDVQRYIHGRFLSPLLIEFGGAMPPGGCTFSPYWSGLLSRRFCAGRCGVANRMKAITTSVVDRPLLAPIL